MEYKYHYALEIDNSARFLLFLHDVISAKSNLFIFIYSFLKKESSTKVSEIIVMTDTKGMTGSSQYWDCESVTGGGSECVCVCDSHCTAESMNRCGCVKVFTVLFIYNHV